MSKLGKEETRCNASALHKETFKLLSDGFPHFDIEQEYPIKIRNSFHKLVTLYLDMLVPKLKIAIECHGRQHFESVGHFGGRETFKKQQMNDRLKAEWCKNNQIALVIVRYDDKLTVKLLEKRILKQLKE